jgi:hypothetical protein
MMPIKRTPDPPAPGEQPDLPAGAPIADVRDSFARKTPQSDEDRAQAQSFIDGKIEMIRSDTNMTEAEKASAIADLESRR